LPRGGSGFLDQKFTTSAVFLSAPHIPASCVRCQYYFHKKSAVLIAGRNSQLAGTAIRTAKIITQFLALSTARFEAFTPKLKNQIKRMIWLIPPFGGTALFLIHHVRRVKLFSIPLCLLDYVNFDIFHSTKLQRRFNNRADLVKR
jgi:hypothetical protein